MSIGVYLRVSSNKGQDTRSQEPDLQTWARAQTDDVAWYRDKFTGTVMERPGLERLLADVRSGKVSKVVVWRLDRLGRTAKGLLTLLDELQALGIGFVTGMILLGMRRTHREDLHREVPRPEERH